MKKWLYMLLEVGPTGSRASQIFDAFMILLISANVVGFAAATVPEIAARFGHQLAVFNIASIAIFTLEYVARLWVCTEHPPLQFRGPLGARLRYAGTPAMLIDLAVIAPFYIALLVPDLDLRVLLVFRLLRFFKLMRYSPALETLGNVLVAERRALFGSLVIMMGVLMIAATAIHLVEGSQPGSAFATVPGAMWWAISTLTTVGYGDVVPTTALGRVIGGLVMLMGLGMFALPIGIIATGFAQEIHRREFVVTWGMLARVPLFQGLDASSIADIMSLLRTQIFTPGSIIIRKGEPAAALYFISSGTVDVILDDRVVKLSEGEFFGEVSLLEDTRGHATARAHDKCRLLVIEKSDFMALLTRNELLAFRLRHIARERHAGRWEVDVADILEQEARKSTGENESRFT